MTKTTEPAMDLARIRRQLQTLADARRLWPPTPRDDARWLELCTQERALLHAQLGNVEPA